MPNNFIESFPEEFILECRMNMNDSQFNFWFDDSDGSGIGYCERSYIEKCRNWMIPQGGVLSRQGKTFFLNFDGGSYMKLYRSDYRDYYLNGYGTLDPSILSHDILQRLKAGIPF